jgi:hypothetical protein
MCQSACYHRCRKQLSRVKAEMTGTDILNATDEQLAAVTNEELASALENAASLTKGNSFRLRNKIMQEVERRKHEGELARPFNPRADVSADAQYLWKRMFIWFWVVPAVVGVIAYIVAHS